MPNRVHTFPVSLWIRVTPLPLLLFGAPIATVVPSADSITLSPLRSPASTPEISVVPNRFHDPYVVATAPGGATIALAVVGIITTPGNTVTDDAFQLVPNASLYRTFVLGEPAAPAPTANHRCVCGENATSLMLARLAISELVDFVQPVAPLGAVVQANAAPDTPEEDAPTPPATHHAGFIPLYALALILLLTVATVFTPPSNMKFLVP